MTSRAQREAPTTDRDEPGRFLDDGMRLPFVLLLFCFAGWGIAANMTDPLVKVFGSVFDMSTVQSTLVQSAYYGAYFLLAIPAAFLNSRFSYKVGVLTGLGLAAIGGMMFVPAANAMTYGMFLLALFLLAAGLSVLETSANPFVMVMGPETNATRRLNFAQAFNPPGTLIGAAIAGAYILPRISEPDERAALSGGELRSTMSDELTTVMLPYVSLAVLLVIVWVGILLVRVPGQELTRSREVDPRGTGGRLGRLVRNRHYSFGVVAQYFNVAAQTCIWTFTVVYVADHLGADNTTAGRWQIASLIVFAVFRFLMVWIMGFIDSRVLMLVMCTLGIVLCLVAVLTPTIVGAVSLVALSACLSLLFPTIYGTALEGLGEDTKFGAAGLVMAIVGGATMPLVQGALIDTTTAAISFVVPAACFAVIVGYAVFTLRGTRVGHHTPA